MKKNLCQIYTSNKGLVPWIHKAFKTQGIEKTTKSKKGLAIDLTREFPKEEVSNKHLKLFH